jgi:hypothetical protein
MYKDYPSQNLLDRVSQSNHHCFRADRPTRLRPLRIQRTQLSQQPQPLLRQLDAPLRGRRHDPYAAESNLPVLKEKWGGKYRASVRSRRNNWEELAPFFDCPKEIRRLIYPVIIGEGDHQEAEHAAGTLAPDPRSAGDPLWRQVSAVIWLSPYLNILLDTTLG